MTTATRHVYIDHHGSVVILTPHTDAARVWMAEHLPEDAPRWGRGYVVEPRYVSAILEGMEVDLC